MLCIKCHTTSQVQRPSMQKYFPSRLPMNSTLVHEQSDTFGRGEKIDAWPRRNLQMPGSCQNCIEATNRGTAVLSAHWGEFFSVLMWGHFTHTHTHTLKKTHPRHTFITQTSSHIQTDSDTHRFSPLLPTSSTLANSPPPNNTQSQTHTHTRTLAQSVWSVNLVPRGARRVTPLTGQTRLDSQQTDKY